MNPYYIRIHYIFIFGTAVEVDAEFNHYFKHLCKVFENSYSNCLSLFYIFNVNWKRDSESFIHEFHFRLCTLSTFVDHKPLVFSSFDFLFFFWGGGRRGTIKQFIWNQFELKRFKNKNKEKHINEQSAVAFDTHCLTMCYSYPTFIEPNSFISNWITFHLTTFCYLRVPNPPTRPYPPIYQRDSIELNQFCTVQWQ